MKRISFGQICLGLGLISVTLPACQPQKEIPWQTFAETPEPFQPRPNSGNAWDEYFLAANLARRATEKFSNQADLRDVEESSYLSRVQNSISIATRASSLPCNAEFVPHDPFKPRLEHEGLTAIGRGIGIQIKKAASSNSASQAVTPIITAHRIADHLTHGDVQDAMLGYWIASNARQQAAPLLDKLDAGSLTRIGNSILASLDEAAPPSETINNEYKNMLMGVQFVQDAHKTQDYGLLTTAFYKQAAPAIDYLRGLRPQDRPQFFTDFAAEAKLFSDQAQSVADQPANERKSITLSGERPWKRFSQHLFEPVLTFLEARDRHIARSRLFALTCLATAAGKTTGKAPLDFTNLPPEASTDPYTGKPFPYQRAEREFKIYSVGPDGRDDGGESRGNGLEPDITIEPEPN
ncbi:hypothetical protein CCB80_11790 [Armatimonadetes bacterium Uphvl-Ar1]|nr:hypothetical protein CCB80_11790 [Armatimonadetes bacterium Uphvl-Ar1]